MPIPVRYRRPARATLAAASGTFLCDTDSADGRRNEAPTSWNSTSFVSTIGAIRASCGHQYHQWLSVAAIRNAGPSLTELQCRHRFESTKHRSPSDTALWTGSIKDAPDQSMASTRNIAIGRLLCPKAYSLL